MKKGQSCLSYKNFDGDIRKESWEEKLMEGYSLTYISTQSHNHIINKRYCGLQGHNIPEVLI
ncbi:MAG: hypothetical protein MRK02_01495 [Candidatus Scalindua sp.]|nr:hypothetical protein [Candidatus Scalindua sp.]